LVDQSTNQVAVARLDAEGVERQLFEGSDGAAEAAS
jgi:hypothetical protein